MEHQTEFEIDFDFEGTYFLIQGTAVWMIDNDSFDYAGTHCSYGKGGTCELPDYAQVEDCSVDFVELHHEDDTIEEFDWQNKEKMLAFEKEYGTLIEEHLNQQEFETGDAIKAFETYHEELEIESRLEAREDW